MVVVPLQSVGPQHWTVMLLKKQEGSSTLQPEYFDSLFVESKKAREQAEKVYRVLQE